MSDKEPVAAMPYELYRAQRANEARMAAAEARLDETKPGGVYQEGDRLVDANGKPVEQKAEKKA